MFINTVPSKFTEGIDLVEMVKMLTWMTEGYTQEKLRIAQGLTLPEAMDGFRRWLTMFKKFPTRRNDNHECDKGKKLNKRLWTQERCF